MTELFASTAPVFTIDGAEQPSIARDISLLRIDEATDGLKTLEMRLVADGPRLGEPEDGQLYLDGQIIDFGKPIEVSIGPADSARTVFDGRISAIEASYTAGVIPTVTVFAEDAMMILRMTRRMKTYERVTDADLVGAIAREHGLTPDVHADGPTYDVVQQWNQSDLAFLRERARLLQADLWVADGTLHLSTRGNRTAPSLTLTMGLDLMEAQLRADLAHQRTSVKVSGYDASQREGITEESGADALQAEVSGGRTGIAILQQAFGLHTSYRVRSSPLQSNEASSWAQAELLRRARGFVSVSGMTNGTAEMVVGATLTLAGVGAPFTGNGYYVTRVCHTYDLVEGFRTHFDAERATINAGGS